MIFAFSIVAVIAIGWLVPRLIVHRIGGTAGVILGTGLALSLGAGVVWIGAQMAGMLGLGDPVTEFNRGFNAWKIMLLLAPASALHARRQQQSEVPED
jgi:hypothetical protein